MMRSPYRFFYGLSIAASLSVLTINTMPLSVQAQTQSVPLTRSFPALQGIHLSSSQQGQIQQIVNNSLFSANSTLSPNQQAQLKKQLAQGISLRQAAQTLGLSTFQKLQLRSTILSARTEISKVLTPQQRQQFQQNLKQIQTGSL